MLNYVKDVAARLREWKNCQDHLRFWKRKAASYEKHARAALERLQEVEIDAARVSGDIEMFKDKVFKLSTQLHDLMDAYAALQKENRDLKRRLDELSK